MQLHYEFFNTSGAVNAMVLLVSEGGTAESSLDLARSKSCCVVGLSVL